MMIARSMCVALLASTLPWPGSVQTVSAQSDVWTTNGPEGGTITTLASDPLTPDTLYAGTWNNGVFKSIDGGGRWINMGLLDTGVDALAIDPQTPDTVYTGTYTRGVFKSTDGGSTWSNTGLTTGVLSLAVDPQTPATLYAGTLEGIFKSTDGGAGWSSIKTWTMGASVLSLAIDSRAPDTLYAGRNGLGVVKSTDGGGTWNDTGLTNRHVYALAIDPDVSTTVYASTYGGVFKSVDGGASWAAASMGLNAVKLYALVIDPDVPAILYSGTDNGVFKSTDGGSSWAAVNSGLTTIDVLALTIDRGTPATVYAGTKFPFPRDWNKDIGVFKTTDGGDHWIPINRGLIATIVSTVAIDPQNPATVYAATERGIFKSTDGASNWSAVNTGLTTPWVSALAIDTQTPTTLYAGSDRGVFQSINGGASWNAVNTGLDSFVTSLVIDPQVPSTLYAGTGRGVFKSTDSAGSWSAVDMGMGGSLRVNTLSIDPQVSTTLYASGHDRLGRNGGGTFKSTDGGASWTMVNTLELIVAVDPQTPTTLYGAQYGGDQGVFKSTDGGASWSFVNMGLTNLVVLAITIDPQTPTTLYAGARGGGVFRSTDGGDNWNDFNQGLTNATVNALAIDATMLVAGTNGGAFTIAFTPRFMLTVGTTGEGTGTVTSNPPGITCGTDCDESYTSGTIVTLEAAPASESVFTGWSGCDSVDGTSCTVTMTAATAVTATFELERFILTVATTGDGAGTVSSSPSGIECGMDCSELYLSGTTVTLNAAPAAGSIFAGWSGCDSVDGTSCTVTVNAAAAVTARFDLERFTLTASRSGLGSGTVMSSPSGIACGADCSESYITGTTVTLTARPALGSIFTGWSGCDAVSGARCTVVMNAARSVNARFLGIRLGIVR